ncbi:RNA polymerase sigma factor [Actinomadura roseirufa]|uniref:RNA polymerase sigma factor n=1 Tax=Actinomadura roseirufa TaxID=2094049 RepID=UPI001F5F1B16|nr:SigE family RNA polymerase sigma factor [Actinomadura roseirufa]
MIEILSSGRASPAAAASGEAGDGSFDELFKAHYHSLVRLAGLLGADDPEDIAQDAFARFYRKRRKLRDGTAALAYLRSIVFNLTRNRHRHLRVVRSRLTAERRRQVQELHDPAETALMAHEEHRALLAALDRLPRRQREVLVLRYWLELSEVEISQALQISVGTVKSHAHRGVAALQAALKEET